MTLQKEFDTVFYKSNMKNLIIFSKFLDSIERKMDQIDQGRIEMRDKLKDSDMEIIFNTRIREMWITSFVKQYVKSGGEVGEALSDAERKKF